MLSHVKETDDRWNLFFETQVSMRYHRARQAHYDFWGKLNAGANLVISSAAFVAVTQGAPGAFFAWMMLLLTAWNVWALVVNPSRMLHLHAALHDRFSNLAARLSVAAPLTSEALAEIHSERLAIERDEPPALRTLQEICYRETCIATGAESIDAIPLLRRLAAHFVN
jgi:hypothetical protein